MFHLGFFLFQAPDTEEVSAAHNIIDIIIDGGQVKQILIFWNKLKFGEINMISQLFWGFEKL